MKERKLANEKEDTLPVHGRRAGAVMYPARLGGRNAKRLTVRSVTPADLSQTMGNTTQQMTAQPQDPNEVVDILVELDDEPAAAVLAAQSLTPGIAAAEKTAAKGVSRAFVAGSYTLPTVEQADTQALQVALATNQFTGKGMTIAVLDTGLDTAHPAFTNASADAKFTKDYVSGILQAADLNAEALMPGVTADDVYLSAKIPFAFDYAGKDAQVAPGSKWDAANLEHGTHVAGIIAADRNGAGMHGVAFENAEIIAARWDLMSPISAPVKDVIDMGAKVVNFSLGVDSTADINASTIDRYADQLDDYLDSVRYQIENNVVFVFSAGNESQAQPGVTNGIPLLDEFKESLDGLFVTVVALDKDNKLADYSNACGVAQNYCIAAPGNDVWSPINQDDMIGQMSGTSMAAPVVTGSIAFLMGAYPYMTPQEVVSLVFETADDLGDAGVDAVYGHGLINLNNATQPQGELMIATGSNVKGESIAARSTTMSVPAVFKSALAAKMPRSVTAFDKYKRPYAMPISSFVKMTHSGERNFKNDLYAFSRYQPKRRIAAGGNLAFSYAPSSRR